MLRLTRTAIGLLTAQYRSVLKKCWAINVGIFVLGAMAATSVPTTAMAEDATFTPTLDKVKTKSEAYLAGEHGHYTLTATTAANTIPTGAVRVFINGNWYYYTPNAEYSDLNNLVASGWNALIAGDANDYVLTDGTNYWKYDTTKLPNSVYNITNDGTSSDYTFTTTDGTDKTYYKVALDTQKLGSSAFTWGTTAQSGGTATGSVSFKLPKNGSTMNNTLHYKYTAPSGYSSQGRIDYLSSNVTNKYFFNQGYYVQSGWDDVDTSGGVGDYAYGGVIYNSSSIGNITADFIGNYARADFDDYGNSSSPGNLEYTDGIYLNARGGAIANFGTIGNITGDFINNYLERAVPSLDGNNTGIYIHNDNLGGAIYNSGTIGNIVGDFIGNSTENTTYYGSEIVDEFVSIGGAIYNDSGKIGSITGDFIGNSSFQAGAIFEGKIGSITGDFIGNSSQSYSGAIYHASITDLTGDFIGNYVNSTTSACGGAISSSTITNLTGDFIGNYAHSTAVSDFVAYGGAIYSSSITNLTGDFIGNYVSADGIDVSGGAIYNEGSTINITGDFIGNYASSIDEADGLFANGSGGAIYNLYGKINFNGDNTFSGNYVSRSSGYIYGGAIYNNGTINFNGDNTFSGNHADALSDTTGSSSIYGGAIYNTGTINFNGDNTFSGNYTYRRSTSNIVMNDIYNTGTINIGSDSATANVVLNSGYGSRGGRLIINSGSVLDINENNITDSSSGNTSGTRDSSLGYVTNNGTLKLGVDINAYYADKFYLSSYSGSGNIILDAIHAINDSYTLNRDYVVLSGSTGDAVLTLPDGGISGFISTVTASSSPVTIAISNAMTWDTKYTNSTTSTVETYGVTLTSDRKGFQITSRTTGTEPTGSGDVLAAVNQLNSGSTAKSYTAVNSDAGRNYTTTENLGSTYGTLTVSGYDSTPSHSSLIIGSGLNGFDIGSGATVKLQNLALSGGSGSNYAAQLSGGALELNNVNVASGTNIIGDSGNLNLNGDNTINASLADYTGTTTVQTGTTEFENTVNGFTVNNSALASVKASKLAGNVTLASTGELDLVADSNSDMDLDFSINSLNSRNGILRVMSGGTGTIGTGSISAGNLYLGSDTTNSANGILFNGTTYAAGTHANYLATAGWVSNNYYEKL